MKKRTINYIYNKKQPGIVLIITLVLLIVLSILGYTLTSKVSAQRFRNQYLIDYSKARYGCNSGVKYALAVMEDLDIELINRSEEPDFSDLFGIDEDSYQALLAQWGLGQQEAEGEDFDPYSYQIPGPYGPQWPYIIEPVEFEIDSVKVRIEIEDENAKYPLGWSILDNQELKREIDAGFVTFFELMGLPNHEIESLQLQLQQIAQIQPFKVEFKPIVKTVRTATPVRSGSSRSTSVATVSRTTITAASQITDQTSHFTKLFHSSMLDTETLAKPIDNSRDKQESVLRYVGTWGTRQININTAPRYVLESAFIFGGHEVKIADAIIQRRHQENFTNIADLKDALKQYSDSIEKCEQFITTKSTYFTIKVTAISGTAQASSVIAVTKDGRNVSRIAVVNS